MAVQLQIAIFGFFLSSACVFWIGSPFPTGIARRTVASLALALWLLALVPLLCCFASVEEGQKSFLVISGLLVAVPSNITLIGILAVAGQTGDSFLRRATRKILFALQNFRSPNRL